MDNPVDTVRAQSPEAQNTVDLLATLQHNWSLEKDGVDMYSSLATSEKIPERRKVFTKLSDIELKHANWWAKRIEELGGKVPDSHSGMGHAVKNTEKREGMQAAILSIEEEERRDVTAYLHQLNEIKDEKTVEILRAVILDEFTHAHVLRRLYKEASAGTALSYLLKSQKNGTGSWIGDAVYGINDGLGSIFGIVSGVSGATLGKSHYVLLAGLAGLVASALSMGAGAYLASKSEREIYEAELQNEKQAFEQHREESLEEMAVFFQLKGVPEQDSVRIANNLANDSKQFLKTIALEKMNLSEDALSNPVSSAISGSVSTAIGAFIPIIPFFFLTGYIAVIVAACVSLVAHFAVGAAKSLVTVRSWWSSGIEMTLVGAAEGMITYIIGMGLGHLGA